MQLVTESSAVQIKIALRGSDGSLTVPTTLKYRVDDSAGDSITGWTSVTPESETLINIPATTNAILDDGKPYEDRILTVMADEGLSTQQVTEKRYRVQNLSGVS